MVLLNNRGRKLQLDQHLVDSQHVDVGLIDHAERGGAGLAVDGETSECVVVA